MSKNNFVVPLSFETKSPLYLIIINFSITFYYVLLHLYYVLITFLLRGKHLSQVGKDLCEVPIHLKPFLIFISSLFIFEDSSFLNLFSIRNKNLSFVFFIRTNLWRMTGIIVQKHQKNFIFLFLYILIIFLKCF